MPEMMSAAAAKETCAHASTALLIIAQHQRHADTQHAALRQVDMLFVQLAAGDTWRIVSGTTNSRGHTLQWW